MSDELKNLDCEHAVDAAPYALGALDDASGFELHLETCEICSAEVAQFGADVDMLARSVPPVPAPRALIDDVMATVRAEAEVLNAAGADADKPARRRRFTAPRALGFAAALAAVIVAIVLVASPGTAPDTVTQGEIIAKGMPANASIKLLESDDGKAHLEVTGVPEAGDGRIYEVWLQQPNDTMAPTDALFDVTAGGHGTVHVPDLGEAKAIYITNEPAGGSSAPTSDPLMRVEL